MHADARALAVPPSAGDARAPSPSGPPALALAGIVRRWGKRTVLAGATLEVQPGSVAWLGGPNGSGKTTLLRIAAGVLVPESGSITLAGLDPAKDRRNFHRRLGFLSAGDRGLYARLSVTHNLEFWAGIALVAPARRAELVAATVKRFELEELAAARVDRLSMGQRQRVRLAMTFLHEPAVVLLDEPHNSLDEAALAVLDAALDELVTRGGAALWCSPSHASVPLRADSLFRLDEGKVVTA